jgi:hypothetical protein
LKMSHKNTSVARPAPHHAAISDGFSSAMVSA